MEIKIRYVFEDENGRHLLVPYTIEQIEGAKEGFVSLIERTFAEGLKLKDRNRFTGLRDRNGIEIYEKDIVIQDFGHIQNRKVVCYDKKQAMFKAVPFSMYLANAGAGGWTGYGLTSETLEVIGNIYTNPELVKDDLMLF